MSNDAVPDLVTGDVCGPPYPGAWMTLRSLPVAVQSIVARCRPRVSTATDREGRVHCNDALVCTLPLTGTVGL